MTTPAALIKNIGLAVVGKDDVIKKMVVALLCRGHVLLEDVPGTGKTLMTLALARSLDSKFKRVQCTPDLLPSDITGVPVYNQKTQDFEFHPGPVFTNVLLADEINRATARTQSALLECMAEGNVTVDGVTYPLSGFFMVLATMNPLDQAGTYSLPEAQLDRFMMRLTVGYLSREDEIAVLLAQSSGAQPLDKVAALFSEQQVVDMQKRVTEVALSLPVLEYVGAIVAATRKHGSLKLGASPRAALALMKASQALAFVDDEPYVRPDHVKALVPCVLAHRLVLAPSAMAAGATAEAVLEEILGQVAVPV